MESRPLGIIPAYAGSTRMSPTGSARWRDHPRIRGEHVPINVAISLYWGSSPHTRGAHHRQHKDGYRMGIIPAYAGSTIAEDADQAFLEDHPRIRGEHDDSDQYVIDGLGSSPHTRGAPARPGHAALVSGIIPAYAGSTGTRPH